MFKFKRTKKQTSGCTRCSKIRCSVYSLVSGIKHDFVTGTFCGGDGALCKQRDHYIEHRFGDTWQDFPEYLRKLRGALVKRFKK